MLKRCEAKTFDFLLNSVCSVLETPELKNTDFPVGYYKWMAERCFLPNIRHGQLVVPKAYRGDPDAIPLGILNTEDVFVAGEILDFTARQTEIAHKDLKAFGLGEDTIRSKLDDMSAILTDPKTTYVPISYEKDNMQSTFLEICAEQFVTHDDLLDQDRMLIVSGRPMIFTAAEKTSRKPNYEFGFTMIHELVHVHQDLDQPLRLRRRSNWRSPAYLKESLEREVEAYHVEYSIGRILVEAGLIKTDLIKKVSSMEETRLRENAYTRPFRLTNAVYGALVGISPIYDYLPIPLLDHMDSRLELEV